MCGILGIVAAPGENPGLSRPALESLRDTLAARGPDGAGLFEKRNVAFAHRRLAIRDIAGGSQPWLSPDENLVLVYNGELYNDQALRAELTALGQRFRSRCDTEIVEVAFRQWGADCLSRLRGMFAFGIYDFRTDSLFLARDRFGVKPLFFTEVGGKLVFASSIRTLISHPEFKKAPNLRTVSHYLTTLRLTFGRETVYSGIWQLLPGETLTWDRRGIKINRYWNYPQPADKPPDYINLGCNKQDDDEADYDEAVQLLESGLRNAVASRLVSDVPVGLFLSGGVDSSTIGCLIREETSAPMLGRCGGAEEESQEEFSHARLCAEHAGFDFAETRLDADSYFAGWQDLLDDYATPVSTPTDVILHRLSIDMKQSVGVVLGGEGADEMLCGYSIPHWSGRDYDLWLLSEQGRWPANAGSESAFRDSLRRQYGRDSFDSPVDHFLSIGSLIPTAAKKLLLQPWAWQQIDNDRPTIDYYAALLAEHDSEDSGEKLTGVLHHVNLEGQLARLDSATMLAGLEARVPYTDHVLVEAMSPVPRRFKIDVARHETEPYLSSAELESRGSLRSKRLLRSVAERRMPHALAHRKKASFPTPVARWMTESWRDYAERQLRESPFARELFQPAVLTELAENLPQAGMWLWPLLNVCEWGDRQFAAA
jgi:asparagine synthase (glutamine-hydrolysing)